MQIWSDLEANPGLLLHGSFGLKLTSLVNEMESNSTDQEQAQIHDKRLNIIMQRDMPMAIKFWEADHVLLQSERELLARELFNINSFTASGALAVSMGMLAGPTILDRLVRRRIGPTGRLPPHMPIRAPLMKSPLLSLGLGVIGFQLALTVGVYALFKIKRRSLSKEANEGSSEAEKSRRLLNVWNAIPWPQSMFWGQYYEITSRDPAFKMKDPRTLTEEDIHRPYYRPNSEPIGFDKSKQKEEKDTSEWQHLREINFPNATALESDQADLENDLFPSLEQKNSTSSKPKSRWDEIREGK